MQTIRRLTSRATKQEPTDNGWFSENHQAVEEPNPKSPATRFIFANQRRVRRMIYGSYVGMLLAIMALVVVAGRAPASSGGAQTVTTVNAVAASPDSVNAFTAISQWLHNGAPYPNGQIVSFYAEHPLPKVKPSPNSLSGTTAPIVPVDVSYVVAFGTNDYLATVEVINGVVTTTPSISLYGYANVQSNNTNQSPWPTLQQSSQPATQGFNQAINGWAQAFTSGNPSTLALTVGDPNQNVQFVPLSGVTLSSANIVDYAMLPDGNAVAEVTLTLQQNGQVSPSPNLTYDLLIERPTSAAPVVVAWGPPGTGPSLRPYQNAVVSKTPTAQG